MEWMASLHFWCAVPMCGARWLTLPRDSVGLLHTSCELLMCSLNGHLWSTAVCIEKRILFTVSKLLFCIHIQNALRTIYLYAYYVCSSSHPLNGEIELIRGIFC